MTLRHFQHFGGIRIARNDQDRIVGRIIAAVEIERVRARQLLDLVLPADHGAPVWVVEILRRAALLAEKRGRIVFHPHVALFEHNVALGGDIFLGESEIAHSVGLHAHHQLQPIGGNTLEIGRLVAGGEGIVGAAVFRHGGGKLTGLHILRCLEKEMLQKMGHAGNARLLIRRARAIPHHVHNNRRAMILDHHDFHAVIEPEGAYVVLHPLLSPRKAGRRQGEGKSSPEQERISHQYPLLLQPCAG